MGFQARKRQAREAADATRSGSSLEESRLAEWLLKQLAWGCLSASQCQQIAAAAETDMQTLGVEPPSLIKKFAACGSHGRHVNNVWRDMRQIFGVNRFCEPTLHSLSLKVGKITRQAFTSALWPHEVFASLFHYYQKAWQSVICPSSQRVAAFWRALEGSDLFANHPLSRDTRDATRCTLTQLDTGPTYGEHGDWTFECKEKV